MTDPNEIKATLLDMEGAARNTLDLIQVAAKSSLPQLARRLALA